MELCLACNGVSNSAGNRTFELIAHSATLPGFPVDTHNFSAPVWVVGFALQTLGLTALKVC